MKTLFESKGKKQVWTTISVVLTVCFALLFVHQYSERSTRFLLVKIRSKDVVEINKELISISVTNKIAPGVWNKNKSECVCYSGGEMCSGSNILLIISQFYPFRKEGFLIDGEPYYICTGDPFWPYGWWRDNLPKKTIVITIVTNNCFLRETGDLISDNRERERLSYERFKKGDENWKNYIEMSGAAFSFGEVRKELERRLGSGETYAVSIECDKDVMHFEVINILRICRKYKINHVFLGYWLNKESGRGGKADEVP